MTTTKTELSQAAKLSDEAGPPQSPRMYETDKEDEDDVTFGEMVEAFNDAHPLIDRHSHLLAISYISAQLGVFDVSGSADDSGLWITWNEEGSGGELGVMLNGCGVYVDDGMSNRSAMFSIIGFCECHEIPWWNKPIYRAVKRRLDVAKPQPH